MKRLHIFALLAFGALLLAPGTVLAAKESANGLKTTITAIIDAAKAGQTDKVKDLSKALVLPDPGKFFSGVFGDATGEKLADEYAKLPKEQIAELFLKCARSGRTNVRVIKIDKADDANATGLQKAALGAMKNPIALYTVKLTEPGKSSGTSVWSFVYDGGAFRLGGKMRAVK